MTLRVLLIWLTASAVAACAGGTGTVFDANPVASVDNDTVAAQTMTPDSDNPDDPFDDSLGTEM